MIVTKHTLRLLVGVLVIYCCIETTVGGSIRGALNEDEPSTTLSPRPTEQSSDPTMSNTTASPTDKTGRPKIHRRTSVMPHKKTTTTTEIPPTSVSAGPTMD